MIFNLGSTAPVYELQIAGVPGATVTVSNTKKTYSQITDAYGNAVFRKLKKGLWSVIVRKGSEESRYDINVGRTQSNALNINAIPEFSYTGSYQIVDDNGNPINSAVKNWKIRFLTNGTLTFIKNAVDVIDVFCVGGGGGGQCGRWLNNNEHRISGGGGAGGYTATARGVSVSEDVEYNITIGAGGYGGYDYYNNGGQGGITSAFGVNAAGGDCGHQEGSNGGSGGARCSGLNSDAKRSGATDGNNIDFPSYGRGYGQGFTTREFGEPTGKLYSSGGHGYGSAIGGNNTGDGGGGGTAPGNPYGSANFPGGSGGSGIVVIRNAR